MENINWILKPETPEDRLRHTFVGALIIHTAILVGIGIHKMHSDSIPTKFINITLQHQSESHHQENYHETQVTSYSKGLPANETHKFSKPVHNPNIVITKNSTQKFEHKIYQQPNKVIAAKSQKEIPLRTASLPRKRTISATNHEPKDKNYLARWQAYLEDVGNDHYPIQALENNVRGNLRLMVAINKDGTVNNVKIRQSSGHQILDDAALMIVSKAAPFEPLPNEISQDVDILEIIRTWQFRGNFATS